MIADSRLFIPCIACSELPLKEEIKGLNGLQIDEIWKSRNNDMHGKSVTLATPATSWSPVKVKCGHNIINYYEKNPPHRCVISVLAQRYNFTVIPAFGKFNMDNFVGELSFRQYLNNAFMAGLANKRPFIHKVTFSEVGFFIVTDHPTLRNDFAGFLCPFDAPTWTLIFLSAIGITIAARLGWGRVGYKNASIFSDFLRISSILLGQVGGNIVQLFKSGLIASSLLPVWFWACYILMFNHYQCSILSYLTVTTSPRVPRTMGELLDSDYRVVTRSSITRWNSTENQAMEWSLLTQEISTFKEVLSREESIDKYERLQNRIKFYRVSEIDSLTLAKSLSYSIQEYAGFRQEPIVLMDVKMAISDLAVLLGELGNRYVINVRDVTPFRTISMSVGYRNFLTPYISETLTNLEEFGISGRWDALRYLQYKLNAVRLAGRSKFRKLFRREMADGREPVVFHEAAPVSLKVMKFVFFLCGELVLFAGCVFGWEWGKVGTRFYGQWVRYTTDWLRF
ncbi:hypothetical protein Fcan01_10513 [Folsomia candida]|uniref:Uncharacterized protein n=1 Tax=Folsomia candida TaxID=158441 RepID=A0A226EB55_FOLCA|nr:hypothetical protein Fcan01_10513 [Folsomia candida]